MNIPKLALQLLLLYILYRLVVNFVIPTYRNVRKIRQQFQQMQQNMQQQFDQQQEVRQTPPKQQDVTVQEGEYIDFEEIKN